MGTGIMNEDSDELASILEETTEYYRQRAPQYSDWVNPKGKYEGDSQPDASFFEEGKILLEALESARLLGHVLEIACGTGIWTESLVKNAIAVTALDSSREMIEKCNSRLKANPKVRYVPADFYDWTPDIIYDAVTFSFWISHVPASKLDAFVSKLSRCIRAGGRVFFADQQTAAMKDEVLDQPGGEVASRTLGDGRRFKVFKRFCTADEIRESFLKNGIETKSMKTPIHFYYVDGRRVR